MDLIEQFKQQARQQVQTIVYPEGEDERILSAAVRSAAEGIARPIVLGDPDAIAETAARLKLDPAALNRALAASGSLVLSCHCVAPGLWTPFEAKTPVRARLARYIDPSEVPPLAVRMPCCGTRTFASEL